MGQGPRKIVFLERPVRTKKRRFPSPFQKKIRSFDFSCQQQLFPRAGHNYRVLPKRFRKLLLVFEGVYEGPSSTSVPDWILCNTETVGLGCKLYADRGRNSPNSDLRDGKVPVHSKNGEPMLMILIIRLKWIFPRRQIGEINR